MIIGVSSDWNIVNWYKEKNSESESGRQMAPKPKSIAYHIKTFTVQQTHDITPRIYTTVILGKQDRLSNSIQRIYWITAKKVRTPPPSWQMPFKIFIISFEPFPNKRVVPGIRGNRQFSKIMGCWDLNHFRNFGLGREYKSYVCALSDSKQDETLRKPKTSHNKVFQSLSFTYSI